MCLKRVPPPYLQTFIKHKCEVHIFCFIYMLRLVIEYIHTAYMYLDVYMPIHIYVYCVYTCVQYVCTFDGLEIYGFICASTIFLEPADAFRLSVTRGTADRIGTFTPEELRCNANGKMVQGPVENFKRNWCHQWELPIQTRHPEDSLQEE